VWGEGGMLLISIPFTIQNYKTELIIKFIFTSVTLSLKAYFLLEIVVLFVCEMLQPLKQLTDFHQNWRSTSALYAPVS
jgi:hypothetical protein